MYNQDAKKDAGKLELALAPTQIIRDIAEVRMYGVEKYKDPNNWKKVELWRYINRLEKQYECTGGWKVSDPTTRPFKFSNEMEDWEYHG